MSVWSFIKQNIATVWDVILPILYIGTDAINFNVIFIVYLRDSSAYVWPMRSLVINCLPMIDAVTNTTKNTVNGMGSVKVLTYFIKNVYHTNHLFSMLFILLLKYPCMVYIHNVHMTVLNETVPLTMDNVFTFI